MSIARNSNGWPNRSFEFYINALNDTDSRVRRQAVAALEIMGGQQVVGPLIALAQDPVSEVRGNVARALGKLGDVQAIPILTQMCQDPANEVRVLAVQALGKFKDPLVVEPLINALTDSLTFYNACRALGRLKDARAVIPLVEIIAQDNYNQSNVAAIDVGQIGQPALLPLLDLLASTESDQVRQNVVLALVYIEDPQAVEAVTKYVENADPEFRKQIQSYLLYQQLEKQKEERETQRKRE